MSFKRVSHQENRGKKKLPNLCEACGIEFKSPKALISHLHFNFSLDDDVVNYFVNSREISHFKASLESNITPCKCSPCSTEKLFLCKLCKKTFKNAKGLKQHNGKVHCDQLKSYGCWICGKKFKTKYALKVHSTQVHKRANTVTCEICSLTFASKYIKNKHYERVHQSKLVKSS